MSQRASLHLLNAALEARAAGLLTHGVLEPADLLVVDAVAMRFGEADPDVLLGLAFAVRAPRIGHVGVQLISVREQADDDPIGARAARDEEMLRLTPAGWPDDPAQWEAAVLASSLVGGASEVACPFVRQDLGAGRTLLMTRRMWREQERLATAARGLATSSPALKLSNEALAGGLSRLFEDAGEQGARAVRAAAKRCLTVITGGPGTGKTHSIKRLLALLIEVLGSATNPLRIALSAPTGKAAVRMAEALAEGLEGLAIDERVRERISGLRPRTLHKLLGMRPDGTSRHTSQSPVPADLIVVDEASMIDLALMRRLFEATTDGARLVLLGDRDQLASVEVGTVLADLVGPVLDGTAEKHLPLYRSVVAFDMNHRFKSAPAVASVAAALQAGADDQLERVVRLMGGQETVEGDAMPDRITHLGAATKGSVTQEQIERLAAPYLAADGCIGLLRAAIIEHGASGEALRRPTLQLALLRAFDQYRVLAVHRRGPLGVSGLEAAIAMRCRRALLEAIIECGAADADACSSSSSSASKRLPTRSGHWLGRPLLITENSYELGLYNGDTGLVLPTADGLGAIFRHTLDGRETTRALSLARLPAHMGALAMTVHKSQGSQFRRVALVLAGRDSPIVTRELIYTAITRTYARLDWLGEPAELARALRRRVARSSGLAELLWTP